MEIPRDRKSAALYSCAVAMRSISNLFVIDIEACDLKPLLVKFDDEGQAHISEAYDTDGGCSFTDSI